MHKEKKAISTLSCFYLLQHNRAENKDFEISNLKKIVFIRCKSDDTGGNKQCLWHEMVALRVGCEDYSVTPVSPFSSCTFTIQPLTSPPPFSHPLLYVVRMSCWPEVEQTPPLATAASLFIPGHPREVGHAENCEKL